ncbi:TonB-dependent receptor plug domain-containing protein [Thioflexithrix psekupsensis]|nr:TonB-dependent receptor [Thioflexithrix psekupsensis]
MKKISIFALVTLLSNTAYALTDAEKARLEVLRGLSLEDLQEMEIKLDDVFDVFDGLVKQQSVTVASGFEQSTATAPASTTLITAQDIEAMGARSLDEILEAVPGMHISLSEIGFAPLYDVRGVHSASNYEVLMMVNGIPVKSLTDGGRGGWSPPPVQMIQRIEIIRGPGSALYGADAVSGVINILTKTAADMPGTEAGLRMGSHATYNPWLLYGGKVNGFDLALSLDYLDTDGHQETVHQDAQSLLDKATGTQVSEAPGRTYLQQQQLNLHANAVKGHWRMDVHWLRRRDAGAGLGTVLVINPEEYQEIDQLQASLLYHNPQLGTHWETSAQLSYRDIADDWFNQHSARPGAIRGGELLPYGAPNNSGYHQRQTRLDLSAAYRGFSRHTVRFGAGYLYADLHDVPWSFLANRQVPVMVNAETLGRVLIPENIRENRYLFAQDTWAFAPNWELTLGLRHDWYSDFDSTTNPRAALVWQINPRLAAKLLYGTAFRAPSFAEMYIPRNLAVVGNSDLKAETNTTWELGLDYRASDNLNLTLNLFNYEISDKIQRRLLTSAGATSGAIYTYDNIGTLKGQGVELESRWKINNKSSLLANFAYAKVEDGNGMEAGDYPHYQAYLRHDWLLGHSWFLDTRLNWVADRARLADDLREPLADYVELDVTLRYKDTAHKTPWNIAVGVRNLLDEDRREPGDPRLIGDYPKAGREWFTEIRYRF